MFRRKAEPVDADTKTQRQPEDGDVDYETRRLQEEEENAENEIRRQQVEAAQIRALEYKKSLLVGQLEREVKAGESNHFAKHQRIRYHHKTTDEWLDGYIVAVHDDDGPDKPYYTISYEPRDRDGRVEKQTTIDRIEPVEFDGEKTWAIMETIKR
jgi:hypothetical protein